MTFSPILSRLVRMLSPYKGRLAMALLGMILAATTEPTLAAMMKILLDKGFTGKPTFSLWLVPAFVIGIFLLRGVSNFVTTYMIFWVSTKLQNSLRATMFARLLDVPLAYYTDNSVGQVINSMMFEVQQVVDMLKTVLTAMIRDSLTVIGLLAYLFWLNWRLTLITLVLIPMIAGVVRLTSRRYRRLTKSFLEINAEMTQTIEETTRAAQVIKIFGAQHYEKNRFAGRADALRGFAMRIASTFAATVPVTQVLTAFAVSVVIVVALVQAGDGQVTVGGFASFITAMLMLLTPLRHLAEINGPLQRGLAAADNIFALMDAVPERTDGKALPQRATGQLDFIDVGFSYPAQERAALSNINLSIQAGQTVAFVGTSGGGKSTLVNLVPDFFTPTSGEIRLDGIAVSDISLASLRAQIAMVSQNVVLFDDTFAANIAYGDEQADPVRIEAAVKAAHLHDVVKNLPQGLHTPIGNNGMRLSGGQRQRLAIARAIYKNAPILILDEATSALDTESERAVQAALDALMQGRTTLVIAHRLSTIERADRIVVLDHGQIAETGTHAELLEKNGIYAKLYQLQFS